MGNHSQSARKFCPKFFASLYSASRCAGVCRSKLLNMVLSRSMSYLPVQHLWSGILLLIDEQSAVKVFDLYKLGIYLVFLDGFLEGEGLSVGMKSQRVTIGYILKGSSPCNLRHKAYAYKEIHN